MTPDYATIWMWRLLAMLAMAVGAVRVGLAFAGLVSVEPEADLPWDGLVLFIAGTWGVAVTGSYLRGEGDL